MDGDYFINPEYPLKRARVVWQGNAKFRNVGIAKIPTTFEFDQTLDKTMEEFWDKYLEQHPDDYDGPLCRYEGTGSCSKNRLTINVSATSFMYQMFLKEKDLADNEYPRPLGAIALQITDDEYIPFGLQRNVLETGTWHFVGSGYVDMITEKPVRGHSGKYKTERGFMLPLDEWLVEDPIDAAIRECGEEATYGFGGDKVPVKAKQVAAVCLVQGGQWNDAAVCVRVPLGVARKEIGLKGDEQQDLLFLDNDEGRIAEAIRNGGMKGIPFDSHSLASLGVYLRQLRAKK